MTQLKLQRCPLPSVEKRKGEKEKKRGNLSNISFYLSNPPSKTLTMRLATHLGDRGGKKKKRGGGGKRRENLQKQSSIPFSICPDSKRINMGGVKARGGRGEGGRGEKKYDFRRCSLSCNLQLRAFTN